MKTEMPIVWMVAASDCSGAAGLQADIATCHGLDVHPSTVVSAVTAQNSLCVSCVTPIDLDTFSQQLQALQLDTTPLAIKIGLLGDARQVHTLIKVLVDVACFTVLDPVLSAGTGETLIDNRLLSALRDLLPFVDLITPNIPEAEMLTGLAVKSNEDVVSVADALHRMGASGVLIKGGHARDACFKPGMEPKIIDYLSLIDNQQTPNQQVWLVQSKVAIANARGTGCTLSSAIAAFYARGESITDAVTLSSAYVHQGLKMTYQLGAGPGPIRRLGWPKALDDFPKVCDALQWLELPQSSRCGESALGLYPVVDSIEWLQAMLALDIDCCQLRIKDVQGVALEEVIEKAVNMAREKQCRLFINDYWELSIRYGAYGVHLGQEDIKTADLQAIKKAGLRLGISTHGDFEWARAAALEPSYIAIGAIFPTETKVVRIVGVEALKRWVALLKQRYRLTAIGGIHLGNLQTVLETGIDSVAIVSAITKAPDVAFAVAEFQEKLIDFSSESL